MKRTTLSSHRLWQMPNLLFGSDAARQSQRPGYRIGQKHCKSFGMPGNPVPGNLCTILPIVQVTSARRRAVSLLVPH